MDPVTSEDTNSIKYQKTMPRGVRHNLQKIKDEEDLLKEAGGGKHHTYR